MIILTRTYTDSELEVARDIYMDSFPAEERRDWTDLMGRSRSGEIALELVKDGDCVIGLVTVWHLPLADYVEHFALDRSARGKGVGSEVIDRVVDMAADRAVVLEVEPSGANSMAARRIGFYQRHGFDLIDYEYMQPPYGKGLPWVRLMLMATKPVDAGQVSRSLHQMVYGISPGCGGNVVSHGA